MREGSGRAGGQPVPLTTELRQAEKCRHWRKGGELEWGNSRRTKGENIKLKFAKNSIVDFPMAFQSGSQ
jgi:hypothetical protein